MSLNPKVFLSYSWKNQDIANEIDLFFASIGIPLTRDIRDAKEGASIKKFMQTIQKSDYVLMLVSTEYLQSIYCMYEVLELIHTHEFEDKVIPILTVEWNAVFSDLNLEKYFDYWKTKVDECNARLIKHVNEKFLEEKRKTEAIYNQLGAFFSTMTDLKIATYSQLKNNNYRSAVEKIGFDQQLSLNWLWQLDQISDLEEKETLIDDVLSKEPNNHYAWFQRGVIAEASNLKKRAKASFKKVIEIFPQDSLAYYNIGRLDYLHFNDPQSAKDNFVKSISINSNYASAHYNLGVVLTNYFSEKSLAIESYKKTIELNPLHADAQYNLAVLLQNHYFDIPGAVKHYKEALIANPSLAEAHVKLGVIEEMEFGAYKKALMHYEKATKIKPDLWQARKNLSELLFVHFQEFQLAFDQIDEYIRLYNPPTPEPYFRLGMQYLIFKSEFDSAENYYKKAITIDPNFAPAYYGLFNLYDEFLKNTSQANYYYAEWQRLKT